MLSSERILLCPCFCSSEIKGLVAFVLVIGTVLGQFWWALCDTYNCSMSTREYWQWSFLGGIWVEWDTVAAHTLCIYCWYCAVKMIGCRECSHLVIHVLNVQVTHLLGVLGFGGFCYLLGASKQTAALIYFGCVLHDKVLSGSSCNDKCSDPICRTTGCSLCVLPLLFHICSSALDLLPLQEMALLSPGASNTVSHLMP